MTVIFIEHFTNHTYRMYLIRFESTIIDLKVINDNRILFVKVFNISNLKERITFIKFRGKLDLYNYFHSLISEESKTLS